MQQASQHLNRAELQAILLYTLAGYSISELSELQQCTVASMKKRLAQAQEKMRYHLGGELESLIASTFSHGTIDEMFELIGEMSVQSQDTPQQQVPTSTDFH